MQNRQSGCVLTAIPMGARLRPTALRSGRPLAGFRALTTVTMLCLLVLVCAAIGLAQANTADLSGTVTDPSSGVVKGAKVTVASLSTGASRTTTTDDSGHYNFVQLPPGGYKLSVDAGAGFATLKISDLVLTVGTPAIYDAHLQLSTQSQSIEINDSTALVETQKTEVSQTVDARRIDNLPINGRS